MTPNHLHHHHHRLISLTKLLASHVNHSRHHKALHLFRRLLSDPTLSLDPFVYPLALKSLSFLHLHPLLSLSLSLQSHLTKLGLLSNPFISSSLLKCLPLHFAQQLFDELPHKNVVVHNTMISILALDNISAALRLLDFLPVPPTASSFNPILSRLPPAESLRFYHRAMSPSGVRPTLVTLLALLRAVSGGAEVSRLVDEVFGFAVRRSMDLNAQLHSGIIDAYGRCGDLGNACRVFDWGGGERDVVVWSSLLSAYAINGRVEDAINVFERMAGREGIRPDGVAFLGVFKACSHAGWADAAREYFRRMREDYGVVPSAEHYACLVDVLGRAGRLREAYEVIKGMPMGRASAKAWGALLGACRKHGEVGLAEVAGRVLFEIEPENSRNYVALASVYAGAGRFAEAEGVRREMVERGMKRTPGSSWVVSQKNL
ncbi:putative pentatricopeptide repeat-containing protein [Acorus calamus]|uniref:Pentatricopeptide repeat-containing protein n=1 Tax=Acorus calamus TaxID=4465 RepID=A0AAV9E911_ACOCL|nr:putative pentatricopeptide repeat-containing protein [Acorus calamus]